MIERDLVVGLVAMGFENLVAVHPFQLAQKMREIEAIRTIFSIARIMARRLLILRDENIARDPPIGAMGRLTDLGLTLCIIIPMRWQPLGQKEIGRQRVKVGAPHCHNAFWKGRDDGPDNLRAGLLIRSAEHTSELQSLMR